MSEVSPEFLLSSGWNHPQKRPEDKQHVLYFFEPFMQVYLGTYDEETDSVCGLCGFSSWDPEVLCWLDVHERYHDLLRMVKAGEDLYTAVGSW